MTTRLCIGNDYFGAGNFGDDLTLAGFLAAAERYPDLEITACTAYDRAAVAGRFPRIRWLPESEAARDDALRNADAWIALGDTPFQLDSGPWLLDRNERERRRCAALAKPMYLLGVGCESREAARDPRSQALLAAAQRIWTRDAFSAETLRPFVNPARLCLGADVAHLVFRDATHPPACEPGTVGLLLAFERREQFDLGELARFVERRPDGRTRWLVQEGRAFPHLERWILERLAPEVRSRLIVMDVDYSMISIEEYLRAFGAPEVTITSRYHAAVVAAWQGSRVLVVSRSPKLQAVAGELGLVGIDTVSSHLVMESALASAAVVPRDRLLRLRDRADVMCDAFFTHCLDRKARGATPRDERRFTPGTTEPLATGSLRASIDSTIPRRLRAGETTVLRCTVTNLGDAVYASAPPHPVELCYRWYDAGGTTVGAGTWLHTALPRALGPGERLELFARVAAPAIAGDYTLALTLLQEDVAWFDDIDPANGIRGTVTVAPGGPPSCDELFCDLSPEQRRAATRRAIDTRTPLTRWSTMAASASETWHRRAAAAAEWLRAAPAVVDLGCGGMILEEYLGPGQEYIPVDLVARDHRTIVLDLERDAFPTFAADTCALLGVLAYLFEPLPVLEKIRCSFACCVVSYNVNPDVELRLSRGWVNHLDREGLVRLFRDAGFAVAREHALEGYQRLFELAPASVSPSENAEVERARVTLY